MNPPGLTPIAHRIQTLWEPARWYSETQIEEWDGNNHHVMTDCPGVIYSCGKVDVAYSFLVLGKHTRNICHEANIIRVNTQLFTLLAPMCRPQLQLQLQHQRIQSRGI